PVIGRWLWTAHAEAEAPLGVGFTLAPNGGPGHHLPRLGRLMRPGDHGCQGPRDGFPRSFNDLAGDGDFRFGLPLVLGTAFPFGDGAVRIGHRRFTLVDGGLFDEFLPPALLPGVWHALSPRTACGSQHALHGLRACHTRLFGLPLGPRLEG